MSPYEQATVERDPKREHRTFWAITDWGTVEQVEGFDCGPHYEGKMWWVPTLGYSMTVGAHIFDEMKPALHKAIFQQRAARNQAQERLELLEQQLKALGES